MTLLDQAFIKDIDLLISEMNNQLAEAKKSEPIPKVLRRFANDANDSSCVVKPALFNQSLYDFSCQQTATRTNGHQDKNLQQAMVFKRVLFTKKAPTL